MNESLGQLYLDLMKKTLSFTLWEEPPIPIQFLNYRRPLVQRIFVWALSGFLRRVFHLSLMRPIRFRTKEREDGMIWPSYAETMIGLRRLDNIQYCVESALQNDIQGDLIEAGVWRGGAAIFMRALLAAYAITDRRVYVADSFQGLPKVDVVKYPEDIVVKHLHREGYLAVSREAVEANFRKYGLLDEQVVFLPGWFKDTLPNAPIDKLAVLRIDGDLYQSTIEALENLYPKLSKSGFCIVDDYSLVPPCRYAVDDFREKWKIRNPIERIDTQGIFWQKEETT